MQADMPRQNPLGTEKMTDLHRNMAAAATGILLAISSGVFAEDFDRGQALYENHCRSCHEEAAYTRESRRAASIADLRKWVATWSFHAQLDWTDEEINDVVDFINQRYYRFSESP